MTGELFKRVTKNKSGEEKKLYSLGLYYTKLGEYKKAVDFFRRVLLINPNHFDSKEKIQILTHKLFKKDIALCMNNLFNLNNHVIKKADKNEKFSNKLGVTELKHEYNREKYSTKKEKNKKLPKKLRALSPYKAIFYKEINQLYKEYGTLEKVGEKKGLTRERIRQILVKGNKYKLFEYPIKKEVITYNFLIDYYKNREELIDELYTCKKKGEMINVLSANELSFNKLLSYHNLNLVELKIFLKKRKLKIQYDEYVQRLGHHPTTTEMNEKKETRNIWVKITRYWGSMADFRQEFKYPVIKQGNPKIKENVRDWQQQRSALVMLRKKSYMEIISKTLSESGPLNKKYLARECNINEQNCLNILNSMIKRGEIIRLKRGAKKTYMIKE